MPLYPTVEDFKVAELICDQQNVLNASRCAGGDVYRQVASYMGLSLNDFHYNSNGDLLPGPEPTMSGHAITPVQPYPMVPSSGAVVTTRCGPGEIIQGVREVVCCKDNCGKMGVQLQSADNGIFIALVRDGSPAALAGLRFGDQILSIHGQAVTGMSGTKAMNLIKNGPDNNIRILIRDRPFERTILLHKSCTGGVGLTIHNGRITHIHHNSSAARNGVLINHQLVEVNGQNVMGLKDSVIRDLIECSTGALRLTILPVVIYEHLVKRLSNSLIRKEMDRSFPEV